MTNLFAQDVAVAVIVAASIGWAIARVRPMFKKDEGRGRSCGGCTGCDDGDDPLLPRVL